MSGLKRFAKQAFNINEIVDAAAELKNYSVFRQ